MISTIDHFITTYGAAAIALGAGLEGEAAVTAGGMIAHKGLVNPFVAAACAFAGSFITDQLVFWLARYHRDSRYVRRARETKGVARAVRFIEAHPTGFCFAFRFIYGLRIAGPLAIGLSRIPLKRFVVLNAGSALIWACIFTAIGFRFGGAFEAAARKIVSTDQGIGILVVAVLGIIVVWSVWRFREDSPDAA